MNYYGIEIAEAGEKRRMDIEHILAELRAEREQIEQAIIALEKLSLTTHKRRGRPPKWLADVKAAGEGKAAPERRGPAARR